MQTTTIIVLGAVVIITYIIFIFNGKYSYSQWWFGLDKTTFAGIPFLYLFAATSLMAALGFIYIIWYYKSKLEDDLSEYQYNKIFTEIVISLSASIMWAPLVYYSIKYKSYHSIKIILKSLAMISLGVTAGSSVAATHFIDKFASESTYKTIALVAYSLFIFHTTIVDFGLWNLSYLRKL